MVPDSPRTIRTTPSSHPLTTQRVVRTQGLRNTVYRKSESVILRGTDAMVGCAACPGGRGGDRAPGTGLRSPWGPLGRVSAPAATFRARGVPTYKYPRPPQETPQNPL